MKALGVVRPCRVEGCTRLGRFVAGRGRDVCSLHEMRRRRYGGFTLRPCWGCAKIVDDEGKIAGSFFCSRCLLSRGLCEHADGCERVVRPRKRFCDTHRPPSAPGRPADYRGPRRCEVRGCHVKLARAELALCLRHWKGLPAAIRDRIFSVRYRRSARAWASALADARRFYGAR